MFEVQLNDNANLISIADNVTVQCNECGSLLGPEVRDFTGYVQSYNAREGLLYLHIVCNLCERRLARN